MHKNTPSLFFTQISWLVWNRLKVAPPILMSRGNTERGAILFLSFIRKGWNKNRCSDPGWIKSSDLRMSTLSNKRTGVKSESKGEIPDNMLTSYHLNVGGGGRGYIKLYKQHTLRAIISNNHLAVCVHAVLTFQVCSFYCSWNSPE